MSTGIDLSSNILLDYKAQLLFPRKEYDNAIKKYKKAIALVENYHKTNTADARSANLLSNLHNNLSTAYLFRKKREEAVSELKTAFTVRREYASCPGRYNDSFFFNLTAPGLDNTSATN